MHNLFQISQRALGDLVRLEDGRILEDFIGLEDSLNTLSIDNTELIQKYRTKETNKQKMVELLKQLNMLIDSGSKLRIGAPATEGKGCLLKNFLENSRKWPLKKFWPLAVTQ